MGGSSVTLVRVADTPTLALSQSAWVRSTWTLRQFTGIALPLVFVGAVVALGLRDSRAVALAMVGLMAVLLGWARSDRVAADEAVRRFAEASDALADAMRPLVARSAAKDGAGSIASGYRLAAAALDRLDLAGYRRMRGGLLPSTPHYLVDLELLAVIRACRIALVDGGLEHVMGPLTAAAAETLSLMSNGDIEREIAIFAGDVRRLVTLAPERLDSL